VEGARVEAATAATTAARLPVSAVVEGTVEGATAEAVRCSINVRNQPRRRLKACMH